MRLGMRNLTLIYMISAKKDFELHLINSCLFKSIQNNKIHWVILIMKKTILLSLVSSSLLFSQASNAGQWAIGGSIGQATLDGVEEACDFAVTGLLNNGINCDDSETSYNLNLNYNFNDAWGVEVGYSDFGDFGGSNTEVDQAPFFAITTTADISFDVSALYIAGTGTFNFNDQWSLTGRLGIAEIDLESRASVEFSSLVSSGFGSFSDRVSTTEAYLGASLNYNFNNKLQAQLRYDYFDSDIDANIDAFSLGLKYSFGK